LGGTVSTLSGIVYPAGKIRQTFIMTVDTSGKFRSTFSDIVSTCGATVSARCKIRFTFRKIITTFSIKSSSYFSKNDAAKVSNINSLLQGRHW
jgi:hypothetical protein